MDIAAAMFQAVGVLRQAQDGNGHVLQADGVADGLLRILPAEAVTFNDLDVPKSRLSWWNCSTLTTTPRIPPGRSGTISWTRSRVRTPSVINGCGAR